MRTPGTVLQWPLRFQSFDHLELAENPVLAGKQSWLLPLLCKFDDRFL